MTAMTPMTPFLHCLLSRKGKERPLRSPKESQYEKPVIAVMEAMFRNAITRIL